MHNRKNIIAPAWKRKTLYSALALSGLCAAPAYATPLFLPCPTLISTALVVSCAPAENSNTSITSAGSITTDSGNAIIYSLNLAGTLTNAGTVSASKIGVTSADAYGVRIGSELLGTLTNSGTITARATTTDASGAANAYGIYEQTRVLTLAGTLSNSGTISASATGNDAEASGIYLGYDVAAAGQVINNAGATVSAAANGVATANAYGVRIGNELLGTLTNSGTISATATTSAANGVASAYGIYEQTHLLGLSGTLSNSGAISASATGKTAEASGIYVGNDVYAAGQVINNTGATISATANGVTTADAYGVRIGNELLGTLTNSGTISATATTSAADGHATAYGIAEGGAPALAGTLNNSGTISATANGVNARAYGIKVARALTGTINNSGTIKGTVNGAGGATGYSISVDGGEGSGTINNTAGGLLSGNLYVNGDVAVNNAGTISIPAFVIPNPALANTSSATSAWIAGDYTQQAGGVIETTAISTTSYGRLSAGTADLTGSNTIAVRARPGASGTILAVGEKLENVITSRSGSITGLASGATTNVIGTPLYSYSGLIDATGNVDVIITGKSTFGGVFDAQGHSSLDGLGGTLDGLAAGYTGTGPMDPLVDALYGLNSRAELDNAGQQLAPLVASGITLATEGVLQGVQRIIQSRQNGNRGLSSGDDFLGDRNFWFKPFGSRADQGNRNGAFGYEAKSSGLIFGADGQLSDTTRVGAAFAYARSDVSMKSDAQQSGDISNYQAVLYGSHSLDERTDLNFQADYGVSNNDTQRQISIVTPSTANASYNGWNTHLGAGIGRIYTVSEQTRLIPSFRADYTYLHNNGYTESGAGALNLTVNSNNTDQLIFLANGKLLHDLSEGVSVTADLGLGYDALSSKTSITSSFVGGGAAFSTPGIDPSPWLVRGGLGLAMTNSKAMEFTARYDIETRTSSYSNQTVSLKLRMPF